MNDKVLTVVLVIILAVVLIPLLVFLYRCLKKDDLIFDGGAFALDSDERKRALMPRSMRSKKEKRKSLLKSMPFFCVAVLVWILVLIDANFLPLAYFYSPMAALMGVFVMRYRKSYYDAKGKKLRNIIDLIGVLYIAFSPVIAFIEGYSSFFTLLYLLVPVIVMNLLIRKLRKCDVIKPEEESK